MVSWFGDDLGFFLVMILDFSWRWSWIFPGGLFFEQEGGGFATFGWPFLVVWMVFGWPKLRLWLWNNGEETRQRGRKGKIAFLGIYLKIWIWQGIRKESSTTHLHEIKVSHFRPNSQDTNSKREKFSTSHKLKHKCFLLISIQKCLHNGLNQSLYRRCVGRKPTLPPIHVTKH